MPVSHPGGVKFTQGAEECLKNANGLLNDANVLFRRGRFGTAQSLSVLAMEEAGKAVMLELANLGRVGEDVIKRAMKTHSPKQVILTGLEQSQILRDKELVGQAKDYIIEDKQALKDFEARFDQSIKDLEKRKQNGLYVDVHSQSGNIISSPSRVGQADAKKSIEQATTYLYLIKRLRWAFHYMKTRRVTSISNLRYYLLHGKQPSSAGDQRAWGITILFDEV